MRTRAAARALSAALLASSLAAAPQELQKYTYEQVHFGNIPVELTFYAADEKAGFEAALAAFQRIKELAAAMSDYELDPPSALNRIAAEAPRPVQVPKELFAALQLSLIHI